MKIKKAEESPVIIHKRKETGFSNRGFKPIIKRETDSALPEYNNGGAFFMGIINRHGRMWITVKVL